MKYLIGVNLKHEPFFFKWQRVCLVEIMKNGKGREDIDMKGNKVITFPLFVCKCVWQEG